MTTKLSKKITKAIKKMAKVVYLTKTKHTGDTNGSQG
jgi:hypothetical protein